MGNLPGEPSQDQGAIDTIIRLHEEALKTIYDLKSGQAKLLDAIAEAIAEHSAQTH